MFGSEAESVTPVELPKDTLTDCGVAIGAPAPTVMDIVAGLLVRPEVSVTVKWTVSEPLKPAFGVYVRFGTVPVSVPFAG